tara:strand:+ start:119055 stop:119261 length:207 start_codon:yes stop_codon:yes gene_type:complete
MTNENYLVTGSYVPTDNHKDRGAWVLRPYSASMSDDKVSRELDRLIKRLGIDPEDAFYGLDNTDEWSS